MKSEFNKNWNKSIQPRKQRKFRANAPNHIKRKFMGCNLDKELRVKHKIRSIEVRKGDTVKIMRGQFKGKQGKVGMVDVKNCRIQVEGVQRAKKIGGEKLITWFHPSSVKIIILDLSDNRRMGKTKQNEKDKKDVKKEVEEEEKSNTEKKTVKKATKEVIKEKKK